MLRYFIPPAGSIPVLSIDPVMSFIAFFFLSSIGFHTAFHCRLFLIYFHVEQFLSLSLSFMTLVSLKNIASSSPFKKNIERSSLRIRLTLPRI